MSRFKCDVCGQFISYKDVLSGKASYMMILPDSHLSEETWETLCSKHNFRNKQNESSKISQK